MVSIRDIFDKKFYNKFKRSNTFSSEADELAQSIRVRVRKGYGVKKEKGSEYKFRKLKQSTIAGRSRMKQRGTLLSGEGVSRSNLTATGEMTDSITGKSKSGSIEVYLKDDRNQKLSGYHDDMGRPFFHISNKEYKKTLNNIRAKIKEILRRS